MDKKCQNCGSEKDVFSKSEHKLGAEKRELFLCVHCAARMNDAEKLEKAFEDGQLASNDNDSSV